jgi:hypothetical protein
MGRMIFRCWHLIVLVAAFGCAEPDGRRSKVTGDGEPTVNVNMLVAQSLKYSDYQPSKRALLALPPPGHDRNLGPFATLRRALVVQNGEIVVMEGDATLVSDLGDGKYGIVMTNQVQNPVEITRRFFETYPDEYDQIVVYTTFPDAGANESVAWHLSAKQDVEGIGADLMDSTIWWGAADGFLGGFINMQYIGKYGSNMATGSHWAHAVLAHEFAHQWLVHAKYVRNDGTISTDLLGRQGSHWANGVQTFGSVMDGHEWKDLGGGYFKLKGKNYRYSELDQYLMGLRSWEEVGDFYLIRNMTHQGQSVPHDIELPSGISVTGEREDITMAQVVSALGPRKPDYTKSEREYRIALVLLTRPGEFADTVKTYVDRLEAYRKSFEQRIELFSDGGLSVCTQVSSPCDSAGVMLFDYTVEEYQGNSNGTIDPGEMVAVQFSVKATGVGTAKDVEIELQPPTPESLSIINPVVGLGDIEQGPAVVSTEPLLIKIPPAIACGETAVIPVMLQTENRFFPSQIRFRIGVESLVIDRFDDPDAWSIDPYTWDTATSGKWEITAPKGVDTFYLGLDLVIQPSEDHSVDGINALVTGASGGGHIGKYDLDDGVTTALSPVFDISEARDPILTWYSWHFAYDFQHPSGKITAVDNDALITEVSADGGVTWTEVDRDTSNSQKWERKDVRLAEFIPITNSFQVRFVIEDEPAQSLTEAMVDDIEIWDESLICRPDLVPPAQPEPEPEPRVEPEPEPLPVVDVTVGSPSRGGCNASDDVGSPMPLFVMLFLVFVVVWRRSLSRHKRRRRGLDQVHPM